MLRKNFLTSFVPMVSMIVVRLLVLACWICLVWAAPAQAAVNDDRFDGNIFVLYGGNGSLVPPKVTLKQSLEDLKRPALLFFYVDDSADCKRAAPLLNQVQLYYSKLVSIIPINVDSMEVTTSHDPTEPSTYYRGIVPQTVIVDTAQQVRFDQESLLEPETLDTELRSVLGIASPSPMASLKNNSPFFNEFNH